MKKLLITGFKPSTTEAEIHTWMKQFGPVQMVELIREGNSNAPLAVVYMEISDDQSFSLTSLISNYWHNGALITAHLLTH